jgi:hypothetical protein
VPGANSQSSCDGASVSLMAEDRPAYARRFNRTPHVHAFTSKRDVDRLHVSGDASKSGGARLRQCSGMTPEASRVRRWADISRRPSSASNVRA